MSADSTAPDQLTLNFTRPIRRVTRDLLLNTPATWAGLVALLGVTWHGDLTWSIGLRWTLFILWTHWTCTGLRRTALYWSGIVKARAVLANYLCKSNLTFKRHTAPRDVLPILETARVTESDELALQKHFNLDPLPKLPPQVLFVDGPDGAQVPDKNLTYASWLGTPIILLIDDRVGDMQRYVLYHELGHAGIANVQASAHRDALPLLILVQGGALAIVCAGTWALLAVAFIAFNELRFHSDPTHDEATANIFAVNRLVNDIGVTRVQRVVQQLARQASLPTEIRPRSLQQVRVDIAAAARTNGVPGILIENLKHLVTQVDPANRRYVPEEMYRQDGWQLLVQVLAIGAIGFLAATPSWPLVLILFCASLITRRRHDAFFREWHRSESALRARLAAIAPLQ